MDYGSFNDALEDLALILGEFGESLADTFRKFVDFIDEDYFLDDSFFIKIRKRKPSKISYLKRCYILYKVRYKKYTTKPMFIQKNLPYQRRLY